jgi:RNA polymerase sigma-70 factor (ECF subfamily)
MPATSPGSPGTGSESTASAERDAETVRALRAGEESAFVTLVEQYHPSLVRLAGIYVRDRAVAEEVAQETWLAMLRGLDRFEQRSSLKTWLFRILVNRARTRAKREGRSIPFSAMRADSPAHDDDAAVDAERFLPAEHRWPGHWRHAPESWDEIPEERVLSEETQQVIRQAIDALPHTQREVITLRDVEGWAPAEVCNVLSISESNQRVLLHRARSRVRGALEKHLKSE